MTSDPLILMADDLAAALERAEKAERELSTVKAALTVTERELAEAQKALLWYAYECPDQDEPPDVRAAYNTAEKARDGHE